MYQGFAKWFVVFKALLGLKSQLAFAEDDKGASGADGNGSAEATDDETDDDASGGKSGKVAYDTYKKTLGEVKRYKAELKAAMEKLAGADNDKLQSEGKKDELIAKLRGDNDRITKTHKETLNGFIFSSLDSQIREQAASMGCVDVDAIGKLVDLSDLDVDTKTFKADKRAVTDLLDDLKKSKPYLFSKAGPKINGKIPGTKIVGGEGKSLQEMSTKELWEQLKK